MLGAAAMIKEEVIWTLQEYFESLFPKACPNCKRCFSTLREYIQATARIVPAVSYDADRGDWETRQPVGSAVLAICPCGTTIALTTEGMALFLRMKILRWLKTETGKRGLRPSDLLEHLRDEVRKRVLRDLVAGGI